jgi:hypothetical protein
MAVAGLLVGLGGCSAGVTRALDYAPPGTRVGVDDRTIVVYYHPREPAILLQPIMARAFAAPFANPSGPYAMWWSAAQNFFAGSGCEVLRVYELSPANWEATYRCPEGSKPPPQGKRTAIIQKP